MKKQLLNHNKINQLVTVITVFCLIAGLFTGCTSDGSTDNTLSAKKMAVNYTAYGTIGNLLPEAYDIGDYTLVTENSYLQLYYQPSKASVAVFDRRSGEWWYSNPQIEDYSSLTAEARSQLSIDCVSSAGVVQHFSSYSDALANDQVEYKTEDSCLTVTYTFGNSGPDLTGIPTKLTNERYKELCEKMDSSGKSQMKYRYTYDEDTGIWSIKAKNLTKVMTDKLKKLFEEIGYGSSDLEYDNSLTDVEGTTESNTFVIPLKYILQDDSMLVRVDISEMTVPKDQYITSLNVLKYFGALSKDHDGYVMIPDGSGALIKPNAMNSSVGLYKKRIFGADEAVEATSEGSNKEEDILMPIFGVNNGASGYLAIVEDDEASAYIESTAVGYLDEYLTVSADFEINASENIGLSASNRSTFWVSTEKVYNGNSDVRYLFLDSSDSDYSGMAKCYREYLKKHGNWQAITSLSDDMPMIVETVGSVKTEISTVGIVHNSYVALTSYAEDLKIVKELNNKGINNLKLLLNGWTNGGVDQKMPGDIKLLNVLGGKADFTALTDYADESNGNVSVYPELLLNTMSASNSIVLRKRYGSLTIGQRNSVLANYDVVTGIENEDESRPLVSPLCHANFFEKYILNLQKLNLSSYCIGDMANTVYSDFNSKREVLRPESFEQAGSLIRSAYEHRDDILLREPNSKTATSSKLYCDVPSSNSAYLIESAAVPIYQMVFHGAAEYSLEDINNTVDERAALLKHIEYGACLKYKFIYKNNVDLSLCSYSWLKAVDFTQNAEKAVKNYEFVSARLEKVRAAEILCHKSIADGVYAVAYNNGYTVYVNYTNNDVSVGNTVVPALDAITVKNGGDSQ